MENRINSIEYITNSIIELEKKHQLLEWEINGIFVWQTVRVQIYIKIKETISKGDQKSLKSLKSRWIVILKTIYERIIKNSIFYNPFIGIKNKDILVFESSRKYLVNNEYIDRYTKYLCDEFDEKGISYQKFQSSYLFDRLSKNRKGTKHLDFIRLIAIIRIRFSSCKIDSANLKRIKLIELEIFQIFGVRIDLLNIFKDTIKEFKALYPLYKKLFKEIRPREIYIVNSCDKSAIISAAKDNGIIVNELQHGLIAKEGFIQHFPYTIENSLAYFPNRFYLWDNMPMCSSKLPISTDNIIYFEDKYLTSVKDKYEKIEKEKNKILIVSQPQYTNELFQFVLRNLPNMKEYKFIFKLHPIEELNFENDNKINPIGKYNNFKFANKQSSIDKLYSTSNYVLGVYSAALFEASYMGCQILLLNLPGVEMASSLIEKKNARLVEITDDLLNFL